MNLTFINPTLETFAIDYTKILSYWKSDFTNTFKLVFYFIILTSFTNDLARLFAETSHVAQETTSLHTRGLNSCNVLDIQYLTKCSTTWNALLRYWFQTDFFLTTTIMWQMISGCLSSCRKRLLIKLGKKVIKKWNLSDDLFSLPVIVCCSGRVSGKSEFGSVAITFWGSGRKGAKHGRKLHI